MLQINFEDSNFENLFQTDPEYLSETLYRDIKVLWLLNYLLVHRKKTFRFDLLFEFKILIKHFGLSIIRFRY